jgi:hypothetical protein
MSYLSSPQEFENCWHDPIWLRDYLRWIINLSGYILQIGTNRYQREDEEDRIDEMENDLYIKTIQFTQKMLKLKDNERRRYKSLCQKEGLDYKNYYMYGNIYSQ